MSQSNPTQQPDPESIEERRHGLGPLEDELKRRQTATPGAGGRPTTPSGTTGTPGKSREGALRIP